MFANGKNFSHLQMAKVLPSQMEKAFHMIDKTSSVLSAPKILTHFEIDFSIQTMSRMLCNGNGAFPICKLIWNLLKTSVTAYTIDRNTCSAPFGIFNVRTEIWKGIIQKKSFGQYGVSRLSLRLRNKFEAKWYYIFPQLKNAKVFAISKW